MESLKGVKILKVMPSFPFPESGAEQIDRAEGIRQQVRLGCEVWVIAKMVSWADQNELQEKAREWGIKKLILVSYKYSNRQLSFTERIQKFIGKFQNPLYFDGAAYEFAEPEIQDAVADALREFRPQVAWFDYTYLWPLYKMVKQAGVKIITQSNNFEPVHFLDEDGRTLINYLKFVPKYFGERYAIAQSDMVFAVTPKERDLYRQMGACAENLPTRGMPKFTTMMRHELRDRTPLHVFFMGSSYSVEHNKAAARQVIQEIAPRIHKTFPKAFIFHILGNKLPQELQNYCDGVDTIYEGYIKDLNAFIATMDIALIPSLMGAGMQQKVFEPIARGIPTITSPRAISGYDFVPEVEYEPAHTAEEFIEALQKLRPLKRRQELAEAGSKKSAELFSGARLDAIVMEGIKIAIS